MPTDSTDPTTSNLAQSPELSAAQVAAFNADVADVVALVIAFPGTVSTIVSAAEVLAGEPFFDSISFTPSDPSGLFVDTYSVTFNLFGPDDETCSGAPAFVSNLAEPLGVNFGQLDVFHAVDPATMTQPGTYRFVVNYTLTLPQSVAIEGQTACNDPNESVLVLAPPDPGGGGDDDDDEGDDGDDDGDDDSGQDSDDNGSGNSSGRDSHNAALPDTGAADNLNIIGGTGIALTLAGLTIVAATTRRREGTPLA